MQWKSTITSYLSNRNDDTLRDVLRKEWLDIFPGDKLEVYRFLYFSNQHTLFFNLFAMDLKSLEIDLPWSLMVALLHKHEIQIPVDFFDEMVKTFRKEKLISNKPANPQELLKELKSKTRYQFLQNIMRMKQELVASARIAQNEQLADQHMYYMNELRKIAPGEFNVSHLISKQERQKAERILTRHSKRASTNKLEVTAAHTSEELIIFDKILTQANQFLQEQKAKPTDFAYLFRTLEDSDNAVEFIYKSEESEKRDWQLLDYLFWGKQYLSLLNHCIYLRSKYDGQPDSLFAISYAEAVAYWELGEKEKATQLMGQISSMRPDFKSATEILAQWREDGFE